MPQTWNKLLKWKVQNNIVKVVPIKLTWSSYLKGARLEKSYQKIRRIMIGTVERFFFFFAVLKVDLSFRHPSQTSINDFFLLILFLVLPLPN